MNRSLLGAACGVCMALGLQAHADSDGGLLGSHRQIKHVLLISVDGLHALDLSNYVASHPDSNLAELSRHGVTYTNNSTSSPSDSFPGLASLVTGGSPVTTGLWYDDTYNRVLSPPAQTDGLGNPGGSCPGSPVYLTYYRWKGWDRSGKRMGDRLAGGNRARPDKGI